MKKKFNRGYILAETLIVTAFVAGVLVYLYIQLTNLSNSYEKVQNYNTVPNLYALVNVTKIIEKYSDIDIENNFSDSHAFDLYGYVNDYSDYNIFCQTLSDLFDYENIVSLYVTPNNIKSTEFNIETELYSKISDKKYKEFIETISPSGIELYRFIAKFSDGTYDYYATFKFDM